jgi:hypothetical protein
MVSLSFLLARASRDPTVSEETIFLVLKGIIETKK